MTVSADIIGRVATSRAGRDKGRSFIITSVVDAEYVLLADGRLRRMDRPKKKKLRHIKLHEACAEEIRYKLEEGKQVTDAEIRKSLLILGFNKSND